jgi:hypothetical protein
MLDIATTWVTVAVFSGFEANPVQAAVLTSPLAWVAMFGFKRVGLAVILGVGAYIRRRYPEEARWVIPSALIGCAVYSFLPVAGNPWAILSVRPLMHV